MNNKNRDITQIHKIEISVLIKNTIKNELPKLDIPWSRYLKLEWLRSNNIKDANKIRAGAKIKINRDKPNERAKITQTVGGRPRTIAQAQKMGKKYFYDKNGKRKAAVTAEQLKKSGLTLAQWLKKN